MACLLVQVNVLNHKAAALTIASQCISRYLAITTPQGLDMLDFFSLFDI
jgi:hypothetical protein